MLKNVGFFLFGLFLIYYLSYLLQETSGFRYYEGMVIPVWFGFPTFVFTFLGIILGIMLVIYSVVDAIQRGEK